MFKSFARNVNDFKRSNCSPIENSMAQMAILVEKRLGISHHDALKRVKEKINAPEAGCVIPEVIYYRRDPITKDRKIAKDKITSYMNHIKTSGCLASPSGTTYLPVKVEVSVLSSMSASGMKVRKGVKLKMFVAKNEHDNNAYNFYNGRSNAIKLGINNISGNQISKGSICRNPSGHSSMTSTARMVVSISNILAEYMCGNRYYDSYSVAQASILSIIQGLRDKDNYDQMGNWTRMVDKYKLTIPTTQDIMKVVTGSSDHYWKNNTRTKKLTTLVDLLNETEKVAFMYTSDFTSFCLLNDKLGRSIYSELAQKPEVKEVDGSLELLKEFPDDILNHAHHLLLEEMTGKGTNYNTMDDKLLGGIVRGCRHALSVLEKYKDLFQTIFCSRDNGPNVVHMPDMIRAHVPVSDTDSTVVSADKTVEWYFGEVIITDESIRVGSAMALIFGQALDNSLRQLSMNIGVTEEYMDTMEMKPELTALMIGTGSRAKSYFTNSTVAEGNVLDELDLVIKGSELKSSTIPKDILTSAHKLIAEIIQDLEKNKKISLYELLRKTLTIEQNVVQELKDGSIRFFRPVMIKPPEAYADPEGRTPHDWRIWWGETMADETGMDFDAPYRTMSISTTLSNKTKLKNWLDSLSPDHSHRMATWLNKKKKTSLPTVYLPNDFLASQGMPDYIMNIMDIGKVVKNLTKIFYRILEIMGFSKQDDDTVYEHLFGSDILGILNLDVVNFNFDWSKS